MLWLVASVYMGLKNVIYLYQTLHTVKKGECSERIYKIQVSTNKNNSFQLKQIRFVCWYSWYKQAAIWCVGTHTSTIWLPKHSWNSTRSLTTYHHCAITKKLFWLIANNLGNKLHHLLPFENCQTQYNLRKPRRFTLPLAQTKRFADSFIIQCSNNALYT